MKAKELRDREKEELLELLNEKRAELRKLRAQAAAGIRPDNPGKIRALRRDIARILTVLKEKENNRNG